jgi:transcription-repair coupling factor (superfamily II helicase)
VNRLMNFMEKTPEFRLLLDGIADKMDQQAIYGLSGSQKAFVLAALIKKTKRPMIIVTHNEDNAQDILANLQSLLPDQQTVFFPATDWLPYEVLGKSKEMEARRIKCLATILEDEQCCVVTTIQAVERLFIPKESWLALSQQFTLGNNYDLADLSKNMIDMAYERVDYIEGPGQFTIRGGIMDVYPLSGDAVRLEFFDDELDSIRYLDPLTQRSGDQINNYTLYPARELVTPMLNRQQAWPAIGSIGKKAVAKLAKVSQNAAEKLNAHLENLKEKFSEQVFDHNSEIFTPLFYPQMDNFFDYLNRETIVVMDEPARVREYLDFANRERAEEFLSLFQAGEVFFEPNIFLNFHQVMESVNDFQTLMLSVLPRQIPGASPKNLINFVTKPIGEYVGKLSDLAEEIKDLIAAGYGVGVLIQNLEHAERLKITLRDYGLNAALLEEPLHNGQVGLINLGLKGGFQFAASKLAIFTESEIIYKHKKLRTVQKKKSKGDKLAPFVDLKPGDYVVHANHGIGKYLGIEQMEIGGNVRDYFLIKYSGEDKLYVPSDQVNLIQKYLGGEGTLPKLYKLGGGDWAKVKNKVKAAVRDMAEDLLKLYAEREKAVGYAFSQDSIWQREFEERFPYEETVDQLQCIAEVKGDMIIPKPMDRLVCGDVGYGKTEVAIRAAFKAIMDSKQVAVLVPTTILAQQHFVTFSERFAGYPMKVEMLSRFRTAKEQRKIIQGLREGSVDVVIGTHRLVSEDVTFKDLGLLIVDEEQRFGVAHKEKLKRFRSNVDVLTLSATPIPRTMHMAMVNIRDMSTIETPPENRYPVQAYVMEYNPELVRETIRRELNRDGQVFYVHNRVQDLDKIVRELSGLVPDARIIQAHGQMDEDRLEQIMLDFMDQKYDIMVCTTIIETGLDLPNANTIIISDADHLGLSQLYQLKGRVGRSNRKAFAYFLYRKDKIISEVAEKRLSSIRDFTEFGSGFKIAMRDLEIRGAGNLLGGEQHGHMSAVGFDMYCKLLEQSVQELRGDSTPEVTEPSIELNIDAFIDSDYITDSATKTDFYQRLMRARTIDVLDGIIEELIDRFGDPPKQVSNLLEIVAIRIKAILLGIGQIAEEKGFIKMKFAIDPGFSGEDLMQFAQMTGPKVSFSAAEGLEIKARLDQKQKANPLKLIYGIIDTINKIADKQKTLL